MAFSDLVSEMDRTITEAVGGPVSYTPDGGVAVEVDGVFDASYQLAVTSETGVMATAPAVFFRLEDLPDDPVVDSNQSITYGGVTYNVTEVKPDGQGGVMLLLHEE